MSILQAFEYGRQHSNIAHFASMARMAAVDGQINTEEKALLQKMADKLDIEDHHQALILKDPSKFPLEPMNSREERLERLHDLFEIIYVDHAIDEDEINLVRKYAIGLGCNPLKADEVIRKSIKIFGGKIDLEDYTYLLNKD
jgi:uncharacterized tellurite resistance protein B-like protein